MRIAGDPVCPQELCLLLGTSERLWLWFGEGILGMTQENATFWLGTENMNLEALHGEGKITNGKISRVAKYHSQSLHGGSSLCFPLASTQSAPM